MTQNRKVNLISTILCLAAILTIFCTWIPLFLNISINTFKNNSFMVRAFGINYPSSSFVCLGAAFFIFMFILFLLSRRRKASSYLFWINGISLSVILSHIIMWIFLISPI